MAGCGSSRVFRAPIPPGRDSPWDLKAPGTSQTEENPSAEPERPATLSNSLAAQALLRQALPAAACTLPALCAAARRWPAAGQLSPLGARRFSAAVAATPGGCAFQQLFHDAPTPPPLVTET